MTRKASFSSDERSQTKAQARPRRYDRRRFLMEMGGMGLVMFGPPMSAWSLESDSAPSHPPDSSKQDRVLVVLQMTGGNDGLNTVVPYEDDLYARSRPTLHLRSSQVHPIGDRLGLHPEMKEFAQLFQQGRASILQGVGYPNSDRNHPEAMRDWHTGQSGGALVPTGWLGRAMDRLAQQNPFCLPAVFVGTIPCPFALRAQNTMGPTLPQYPATPAPLHTLRRILPNSLEPNAENSLADFLWRSQIQALQMAEKLQKWTPSDVHSTQYPHFGLAQHLLVVAQLIRTGLGIRIYYVELGGGGIGGFDTHAHQAANHGALLREFSASVGAWANDLARDSTLDRVLLMTFSEFGRTLHENGRRGTDHGAAQPIFLVGARLRGGLIGSHPNLADLDADAPKPHTDFRRLYRTVLQDWLGLDAQSVLGTHWPSLPILQNG